MAGELEPAARQSGWKTLPCVFSASFFSKLLYFIFKIHAQGNAAWGFFFNSSSVFCNSKIGFSKSRWFFICRPV